MCQSSKLFVVIQWNVDERAHGWPLYELREHPAESSSDYKAVTPPLPIEDAVAKRKELEEA